MYWPYLRSKENEILAVRELAGSLAGTSLIVPIYKPATGLAQMPGRLDAIASAGARFAWIVNSDEGAPPPTKLESEKVLDEVLVKHPLGAFPAIELRPSTSLRELSDFATKYHQFQCAVVHRNHVLGMSSISGALSALKIGAVHVFLDGGTPASSHSQIGGRGNVLLRDGFQRCEPNGTYPARSNFDDLLYTYAKSNYHGFGDFGPIGDVPFKKGGGQPRHVALHLTEPTAVPALACHHFVSTVSPSGADTATKYFDALSQLCAHVGQSSAAFQTAGVRDFQTSNSNHHFPALGLPKRWSLKHHLEIVHDELLKAGVKPFV